MSTGEGVSLDLGNDEFPEVTIWITVPIEVLTATVAFMSDSVLRSANGLGPVRVWPAAGPQQNKALIWNFIHTGVLIEKCITAKMFTKLSNFLGMFHYYSPHS